jgi:hypothetical protein
MMFCAQRRLETGGYTNGKNFLLLSFQDIKLCNSIKLPLNIMSWRWWASYIFPKIKKKLFIIYSWPTNSVLINPYLYIISYVWKFSILNWVCVHWRLCGRNRPQIKIIPVRCLFRMPEYLLTYWKREKDYNVTKMLVVPSNVSARLS